ncbi:hypothetical protein [Brachybacterium vulturis]
MSPVPTSSTLTRSRARRIALRAQGMGCARRSSAAPAEFAQRGADTG